MKISEAISLRINELCKERNLTTNGLAVKCGLRQSTVSNILNGNSKNPTISSLKKICDGLGVSLTSFFDDPVFQCDVNGLGE